MFKINDKNKNDNDISTAEIVKKNGKNLKNPTVLKRRLSYGVGYVMLIAAVTVVFIIVNLLFEQIPMSIDLTTSDQFSITEETDTMLDGLDEKVEIIALYDKVQGMADSFVSVIIKVLDLYDAYPNVDVSYVALNDNPNIINDTVGQTLAAAYSEGDYIVKSDRRTKRIAASDMLETELDTETWTTRLTKNNTENMVSNAIKYVTLDSIPNLYRSTGLGEKGEDEYKKVFKEIYNMNINILDIDLSRAESIPEDAGAILFLNPERDLSVTEYDMLLQWLSYDGGMAFFIFDSDMAGKNMERFNMLLSELYGMSINNDIISDVEANQIAELKSKTIIKASPVNGETMGPLSVNYIEGDCVSYNSRSIRMLDTAGYFESHPLVQTSDTAVSTEYITGKETTGVATIAACGEFYANAKHSRAVVMGSSLGLTDENYSESSCYLTLYSLDWMLGSDTMDPVDVQAKVYNTTKVTAKTVGQIRWIFVFAVLIYPLVIIGVGIYIWIRRRHL